MKYSFKKTTSKVSTQSVVTRTTTPKKIKTHDNYNNIERLEEIEINLDLPTKNIEYFEKTFPKFVISINLPREMNLD